MPGVGIVAGLGAGDGLGGLRSTGGAAGIARAAAGLVTTPGVAEFVDPGTVLLCGCRTGSFGFAGLAAGMAALGATLVTLAAAPLC